MTDKPWMPLYVAEYLADTGHLRTVEHGAYLLLIMHYWRARGLPDDDGALARIARLSPAEWKKVKPIVQAFFHDGWKHKRIEHEFGEASRISEAGRKAGLASGEARRNRTISQRSTNDRSTIVQRHSNDRDTIEEPSQSQSQSQSQQQRKDLIEKGGGVNVKGEKPPRHGAVSRDKKFVYFEKGTPEFEAYAADYREAKGCDPDVNAFGGRWFDALGQLSHKGTC